MVAANLLRRAERALRVDRVINCAGPETDYRRMDAPLIKSALAQRLARPDALFLGLDVDAHGALIDSRGNPSPSLFAIGAARKGLLWETTAVPELRVQASQLADLLASRLAPHLEEDEHEDKRGSSYEVDSPGTFKGTALQTD